MGLDVGGRRIGVALSDALGITAQRLTVLERREPAHDVDQVAALAAEHGVAVIVVGLPLTMRGEAGEQAKQVTEFAQTLRSRVRCPVEMMDERLTTVQGERALIELDTSRRARKRLIDQVAAQLILQAYLETHAGG